MSILHVVVPARAGSVGVPDKNIALIQGEPLLVRTYRFATQLPWATNVIVSTDSPDYLEVVRRAGYTGERLRPPELATTGAVVVDALLHELDQADAAATDLCILLEPSFVGRGEANIRQAVATVQGNQADSCFGATRVPTEYHHSKQYRVVDGAARPIGTEANINRQALPPAYIRSGEFYLSRVGLIREHRNLFSGRLQLYETPQPFVNIDTPHDLARALQWFGVPSA